jgi:hypothetical protein
VKDGDGFTHDDGADDGSNGCATIVSLAESKLALLTRNQDTSRNQA